MDYVRRLAQVVNGGSVNSISTGTGRISGNSVLVNGRWYHATWGGDFDVADGQIAECIMDGNKCVVVRVHD